MWKLADNHENDIIQEWFIVTFIQDMSGDYY